MTVAACFDSYLIRARLFYALGVPAKRTAILHAWATVEGHKFGHEFMGSLLCREGSEKAVRVFVGRELNALARFFATFPYVLGEIKRGGHSSTEREITHYGPLAVNRAVDWIQQQLTSDRDRENPIVAVDRYVTEAIARHIPKKPEPKKKKDRTRLVYRPQSGHSFDLDQFLADLAPDSHFRHAVTLARLGFHLFAVWGVYAGGVCRCRLGRDCEKPGKHPIPRGWRQLATTHIPTLAKFAKLHPFANWGIATGTRWATNGGRFGGEILTVIDVDERHFGHGSLAALERLELGPLPSTREHSAGGGPHKFFTFPCGFHSRPGALAQGIDVQSYGRFVIGAGMNARGQRYAVTNDIPIERLPDAWARRIEAVRAKKLPLVQEGQRRAALLSWAGGMVGEAQDRQLVFKVLQDRREHRLAPGSHGFSDQDLIDIIDYCIRQESGKQQSEQRARVA